MTVLGAAPQRGARHRAGGGPHPVTGDELRSRFPDLQRLSTEAAAALAGVVQVRTYGHPERVIECVQAGPGGPPSRRRDADPADSAGLWMVLVGELLLARTRALGAAESVWPVYEGTVFAEQTLGPLLTERRILPTRRAAEPDWSLVRRRLGLAPIPGATSGAVRFRAETTTDAVIGFVPVESVRVLLDGPHGDELSDLLGSLYHLSSNADAMVNALLAHEVFSHLPLHQLHELLEGAVWFDEDDGVRLDLSAGDVIVVVGGEVEVWLGRDPFPCVTVRPGGVAVRQVVGTEFLVTVGGACGALVRRAHLTNFVRRSGAFRRRIMHATLPDSDLGRMTRTIDGERTDVVGLARAPGCDPGVPHEVLANLLAQGVQTQFDDVVVVVRLLPEGPVEVRRHFGVWHVLCPVSTEEEIGRVLRNIALQGADCVIVLEDALDGPLRTCAQEKVDRWLALCCDAGERPSVARGPGSDLVPTVCVHLPPPRGEGGAAGALAAPVRSARLVLDLGEVGTEFVGLDQVPRSRGSLERLGRVITDRVVGVALGGGGALGLVHIALLEGLWEAGLPVDIVSGTSFGAVAGAYFCAGPDEHHPGRKHPGLEALERRIPDLLRLSLGALLSGKVLQDFVDGDLGAVRLDRLPVPFVPVSTEAATLTPAFPSGRSVGYGVWCSGALPPVFGSPVDALTGVRFLDGGFVANVPGDILIAAGASLVVVSNAIAAPAAVAGLNARIDLIARSLTVDGLPLRHRALGVGAALRGQLVDFPELRVPPDGRGRDLKYRASKRLGTLLAGAMPSRLEDTLRGLQHVASELSMGAARRGDVVFAPQLNFMAAGSFWRGREILDIAREHRDASGVVAEVAASWRRLKRPRSGVAMVRPPDPLASS